MGKIQVGFFMKAQTMIMVWGKQVYRLILHTHHFLLFPLLSQSEKA
jgi:hypothetical protein